MLLLCLSAGETSFLSSTLPSHPSVLTLTKMEDNLSTNPSFTIVYENLKYGNYIIIISLLSVNM